MLLTLTSVSGCRMFRAEAGLGPGLGADIHLSGLVHVGALATVFAGAGYVYGHPVGWAGGAITVPGFHWSAWVMPIGSGGSSLYEHSNLSLLPPLTAGITGHERLSRPWAFEIAVAGGVLFLRLGIDPTALAEEDPAAATEAEAEKAGQ